MSRSALVRQPPSDLVTIQADGSVGARGPVRVRLVAMLLLAALAIGLTGAGLADVDVAGGLWDGADWVSQGAARIRWGLVPLIAALTALHYLTSALGVRATASGASESAQPDRLGVWEITGAQFAGAAANRLAPAGLGTAAVTCRYLTRRGLPACAATTTVAVVGLVRGLTKLALVTLAIALWSGLGQALRPVGHVSRLAARHSGMLVPAAIVAGVAVCALVATALVWRRRQSRFRLGEALAGVGHSVRHLLRRPRCLLTLVAAATLADLALALAFAMSVMAVPGVPTGSVGSLIALYLLGATAGAAVPTPAGVGSTEAALIAALATVHIPAAQAATGVLLFRVMTFWAPVPAGVLSTRWLRRRGGL
ncbi:lysylphosphatidylglycerol synthase transmembrane domain-containing protein [Actinoallomurus iriomotensis]|uniref:lysylphosphatidylglycerol synthase transmembrane domain-containing protein n=1 Tax=Actinoallomurus iriomotensis TaxID=478107 RepID=UPI0025533BDB|nr:lysylphosphatidylglycerol synthase transmembrane domain-containing protein [Actinoallomurus iriomotensis]